MRDEFMDIVHVTGPYGERAVVTRRELDDAEDTRALLVKVIADARTKARG
jgi:hypothetical protein